MTLLAIPILLALAAAPVAVDGDELFIGTFQGTLNAYRRHSRRTDHD